MTANPSAATPVRRAVPPRPGAVARTVSDAVVMLRRNLLHVVRYPGLTVMLLGFPVVFQLLFVFVFGGTLGAGLAGGGGRAAYVAFVTPGIVAFALTGIAQGTSISVASDMTNGIVARFRTMDVSRAAVLTGHVVAGVLQSVLAVGVVLVVAVAIGFRPTTSPLGWAALLGVVVLASLALTWLAVALGLMARSVETASNIPMPLMLLPMLGSGFVPTASLPVGLRWFAEYQPFTPIMDTMRGLLAGAAVGSEGLVAVGWCVLLTAVGYLWARARFVRSSVRSS